MRSEIKWDPESLWVLPVSSDTGTGNNYKYSLLTPLPFLPIPHCPVSSPWALAQETPPVLVGAKQEEVTPCVLCGLNSTSLFDWDGSGCQQRVLHPRRNLQNSQIEGGSLRIIQSLYFPFNVTLSWSLSFCPSRSSGGLYYFDHYTFVGYSHLRDFIRQPVFNIYQYVIFQSGGKYPWTTLIMHISFFSPAFLFLHASS